jgi:hypothetical protein
MGARSFVRAKNALFLDPLSFYKFQTVPSLPREAVRNVKKTNVKDISVPEERQHKGCRSQPYVEGREDSSGSEGAPMCLLC